MKPRKAATIVARIVNACWYVFKVGVAVALVGGVATGVYMYVRMDDEIRRHVEGILAELYPQLTVNVGGARLVEGKGIAIYDVSFVDPGAPPGSDQLLAIDELMLQCDVELSTLMRGAPEVQRVEVKHPRLAVRRDRLGRWNVAALAPKKPCGRAMPQVVIRSGMLSITDELAASTQPATLRDIHLNIAPVGDANAGAALSVRIDGAFGGAEAKHVEVHATAAGPQWGGSGSIEVEQFQINDQLLAWVQGILPPWLQATRVGGTVDGKMAATWANCHSLPEVHGALVLSDGRVDDARLPASLTDLTGRLVIDGSVQRVEDVRGKCGTATVAASVNRNGWALRAPLALSCRADNVPLDAPLYKTLRVANSEGLAIAGVLCDEWDKFQPAGVVDATLQGVWDGQRWTPTAGLAGRGLSFESDKFKYRLSGGSGTIRCLPPEGDKPRRVDIDITAQSRSQPLHIVGQVIDPKPGAAGWVQISGENLDIDQGMLDAIPNDKAREVIAELHPAGLFNVTWRLERPEPWAEPHTSLTLDLTDVRINYDRFPYPLRNIRGKIAAVDNSWTFSDLVSGSRRPVRGEGYLRPLPEGGHELALRFTAQQAPLDEALFEALQPEVQRAWTELAPRGQIDLVADVNYRTGQDKPNIGVVIQPREMAQVQPVFFPFLMEKIAGTVTYRDGRVELVDMRAQNDRTIIRTNGSGFFGPEGQWEVALTGLSADHVASGLELVSALPAKLRSLIEHLKPSGNFTVHNGVLTFRKSASQIAPMEAEWDFELDCHQTDLQCGIDLKNIAGSVRLRGSSDGVRSFTTGELNLESVTFQDIQFTNVRGPMWVNDSKCLLGKWATEQQQAPARPLTGNVYDGSFSTNAWVTFDNLPEYQAEVRVVGASLRRLVVERFHAQRQFDGKVDANMVVAGKGYKMESLVGDGDVHIREANLYELSLLANLLKLIKTGEANKTAFTESDIEFQLQGRHIVLDRIDFLGDVVNLYGQGETDFDQNLTLRFWANIGRHDYQLPIVKSFVKQTNQQIAQMYVNGTLSEPKVTTEAFPGIAQMLQRIGADLKNPMAGAEERQEQRRRLAAQQQEATRQ